jgi:nucleolar complex protein 3
LGELLLAAPHFNFRSNVLKLLCNRAGSPHLKLRQQCCLSLSKMFAADQQGDISLEAVKQMAKAIKDGK